PKLRSQAFLVEAQAGPPVDHRGDRHLQLNSLGWQRSRVVELKFAELPRKKLEGLGAHLQTEGGLGILRTDAAPLHQHCSLALAGLHHSLQGFLVLGFRNEAFANQDTTEGFGEQIAFDRVRRASAKIDYLLDLASPQKKRAGALASIQLGQQFGKRL